MTRAIILAMGGEQSGDDSGEVRWAVTCLAGLVAVVLLLVAGAAAAAIPAAARAALPRMAALTVLMPATSTTDGIITMSLTPT